MKRITIFSFYDLHGFAGADTLKQLEDLREISFYLVVVVNGKLHNYACVAKYADRIIFRENRGYDAGGYKRALNEEQVQGYILQSDELIFCNNTFWGPVFGSYDLIIEKMKKSSADFWGLVYQNFKFNRHIQSYFMCFRRRIIDSGDLNAYMTDYIDENTMDYNEICCVFEIGLFEYLVSRGYQYDALIKRSSCNVFVNPYQLMVCDHLPIIKKKCFALQYYNEEKALMALAYVYQYTNYDVGLILQYINRVYGIHIKGRTLEKYHIPNDYPKDQLPKDSLVTREDVFRFVKNKESIYIYGAGEIGKCVFYALRDRVQVKGFIVSDNRSIEQTNYKGVPICRFSEISSEVGCVGIIVAMSAKNSAQVKGVLEGKNNILYMW